MIAQHLRHPLEGFDFRPGFGGLEWSCPSPWQVPEGMYFHDPRIWSKKASGERGKWTSCNNGWPKALWKLS